MKIWKVFLSNISLILINIKLYQDHGRNIKYFAMAFAPGDDDANNYGGHNDHTNLCQGLYTHTFHKLPHSSQKEGNNIPVYMYI